MEMFYTLLKYFFIAICILSLFQHILDLKLKSSVRILQYILAVIPAAMACIISPYLPWCKILIVIIYCFISNLICAKQHVALTLFATLISYTINSGISYSISLITGVVYALVQTNLNYSDITYWLSIINDILNYVAVILIFRIKRFSHGMPFLYSREHYTYYFILSFMSILSGVLTYFFPSKGYAIFSAVMVNIVIALQLFIWWRDSITMSYTQNRFVHDTGLLESEIERQNTELEKLHKDVERLSSIVHKDNKLIPAMEMAVSKCVTTGSADEASKLLEELHALSDERKGILLNNNAVTYRELTNDTRTDAILNYFVRRSQDSGIDFKMDISSEYRNRFAEFISSPDICTILADLLENAFYAVRGCSSPAIFLVMSFEADIFTVKLFDNGCPFPKDVRKSMGSRRITSHPDDGGSGIGMVTISRLAKKNTGRLSIIEPADVAGYTKAVAVKFSKA